MSRYKVRINFKNGKHSWIDWCNKHWYGTVRGKLIPDFTLEEAKNICIMIANHYQTNLDIINENGRCILKSKTILKKLKEP